MMDFTLKVMEIVFKTMDSAFKMMYWLDRVVFLYTNEGSSTENQDSLAETWWFVWQIVLNAAGPHSSQLTEQIFGEFYTKDDDI